MFLEAMISKDISIYLTQKDMGLIHVMQNKFVDWTLTAREMSNILDPVFKPLNWIEIEPD